MRADLKVGSASKVEDVREGKPYSSRTNSTEFGLNNCLALGLQLSGSGRKEAQIIPGMLNLSSGFMTTRYTWMQEELGLDIIAISKEKLEENLNIEMSLTPEEVDGLH